MSRVAKYFKGVFSSYILLGANLAFSFTSIPLALSHLGPEQFGLWVFMLQVAGYLNILDMGMSGAVSRHLIAHKDDISGGKYGALIKIGWIISTIQGLILMLVGILTATALSSILGVSSRNAPTFTYLLWGQCFLLFATFATRIFSQILVAHQRYDLYNYSQIAQLLSSLVILWTCFSLHLGIYSLLVASAFGVVCLTAMNLATCLHLKLFPNRGHWGTMNWHDAKDIIHFGKDILLLALGNQLISGSQLIIITKVLGLDAAATWTIGTKMFTFCAQLISKLSELSASVFSEMMERKEIQALKENYLTLMLTTAAVSAFAGLGFALCNADFISIWTSGKITWLSQYDVLLAINLIIISMLRPHHGFMLLTMKLGGLRWINLIEGVVVTLASLALVREWGYSALISISTVCTCLFSGGYGLARLASYLSLNPQDIIFCLRPFGILLPILPLATALFVVTQPLTPIWRFLWDFVFLFFVCLPLLFRFGLPRKSRTLLLQPLWRFFQERSV